MGTFAITQRLTNRAELMSGLSLDETGGISNVIQMIHRKYPKAADGVVFNWTPPGMDGEIKQLIVNICTNDAFRPDTADRVKLREIWNNSDEFKMYCVVMASGRMGLDRPKLQGKNSPQAPMVIDDYDQLPDIGVGGLTEEDVRQEMLAARIEGIREMRKIIRMRSTDGDGAPISSILGAKIRATVALDAMARKDPMPSGVEKEGDEAESIDKELSRLMESSGGVSG